ncbi:MAG TPA: hypothetical protein VIK93_11415 [Limnochordales bacterium]
MAVISVAPLAAEKMREYMRARGKQDKALRIWLKSLSRMTYGMAFDDCRPGDVRVECDGFTVVLDPVSATCFQGARLVWVETAAGGRGFALELPAVPAARGARAEAQAPAQAGAPGTSAPDRGGAA